MNYLLKIQTSLCSLLLVPGTQYGPSGCRTPSSSSSSVPYCVSPPPHLLPPGLAPKGASIFHPKPLLLSAQQQQGGSTQVHGSTEPRPHETSPKTGNHQADMPLLAGSREEETRARQEEAGQEVGGCSAGGFLSFPQSCSHAGVPTVKFLEVIWVLRSEAQGWGQVRVPRGYSAYSWSLGLIV